MVKKYISGRSNNGTGSDEEDEDEDVDIAETPETGKIAENALGDINEIKNEGKETNSSENSFYTEGNNTIIEPIISQDSKSGQKPDSKPESHPEPEPEPELRNIFVKYDKPNNFNQNDPWEYPVVKFPNKGYIVRSYREGGSFLRGYKEQAFEEKLKSYLSQHFEIKGNIRLNTSDHTRPYEPDIALIDLISGLNIRIDIEIDEPYAGISRNATHVIGEDEARDEFFINRGWIVIRFTEKQVYKQEVNCIAFVSKVIKSIYSDFSIPDDLVDITDPIPEEQWNLLQAQKWESDNYREDYLNHKFGYIETENEFLDIELSEQEKAEEELVEETYVFNNYESNTEHPFTNNFNDIDSKIKFDDENHKYFIEGIEAISVQDLVEKFFHAFDRENSARERAVRYNIDYSEVINDFDDARKKGKELHQNIDKLIKNGEEFNDTEFNMFSEFWNTNNFEDKISRWHIYNKEYMIAGTVDLFTKNNGSIEIYDWIRSKNIVDNGHPIIESYHELDTGIGPLNGIQDTSYWKYSLRLNFYKYILEKKYNQVVDKMFIVVLHEDYNQYYKLQVDDMQDKVEEILNAVNHKTEQ